MQAAHPNFTQDKQHLALHPFPWEEYMAAQVRRGHSAPQLAGQLAPRVAGHAVEYPYLPGRHQHGQARQHFHLPLASAQPGPQHQPQ